MLEAARWHEDPLARVVVTMMLDTGLRVSEICDLDLDAVDVDDQSAMVIRQRRQGSPGAVHRAHPE